MPSDATNADDEASDDQAPPLAGAGADPDGPNLNVTQNALLGGNYLGDCGASPLATDGGSYGGGLGTTLADPQTESGSSDGLAPSASLTTGDPTSGLALSLPQLNRILGDGSASGQGAWQAGASGAAAGPIVGNGAASARSAVPTAHVGLQASPNGAAVLRRAVTRGAPVGSRQSPVERWSGGGGAADSAPSFPMDSLRFQLHRQIVPPADLGVSDQNRIWTDIDGSNYRIIEDAHGSHKVRNRSVSPWDPEAEEATRRNLDAMAMAGMDPLAALVGLRDWLHGVDDRDRYNHMLGAFGVGQAVLGMGGSATAARDAAWIPSAPRETLAPLESDPNGMDAGINWRGGIRDQGIPWEDKFERDLPSYERLPPGSKVFDFSDEGRRLNGISLKTMNTAAPTYTGRPAKVFDALRKHVQAAADYDGSGRNSYVDPNDLAREVHVAVSHYTTPEQWMHINRAGVYAHSRGVPLKVTKVK